MAETIITPRRSWWEKIKSEFKSFSPQVKQALIMVAGTASIALITAIVGWIIVYSENSRLKAKVLEQDREIANLRFQNHNLVTSNQSILVMVDPIRRAYPDLPMAAALAQAIKDIETIRHEAGREHFKPFSTEVRAEFLKRLKEFEAARPNYLTNVQIEIDVTSAERESVAKGIFDCVRDSGSSIKVSGGSIAGGPIKTTIFYRSELQGMMSNFAHCLSAVIKSPIAVRPIQDKRQIHLIINRDLLFETNGMIVLKQ